MSGTASTRDGRRRGLLAIDTATTRVIIATGSLDGVADGVSTWVAGHRHGETLLPTIGRFLAEQNLRRSRLAGIVVGTGPGAFTGLRVGLATAKGLAHGLGIPLVGVSTAEALIASAARNADVDRGRLVLLVPAGPSDRIAVRSGQPPVLVPGGADPELRPDDMLVAVDLADRAPDAALERGEAARAGLGPALLELGAPRIHDRVDELATLVPEYVTLPRGTRGAGGEMAWSRDPR